MMLWFPVFYKLFSLAPSNVESINFIQYQLLIFTIALSRLTSRLTLILWYEFTYFTNLNLSHATHLKYEF